MSYLEFVFKVAFLSLCFFVLLAGIISLLFL